MKMDVLYYKVNRLILIGVRHWAVPHAGCTDPKRVKEMLLRDAVVEITPYLEEIFVFDTKSDRELRIVMPRKANEKKKNTLGL